MLTNPTFGKPRPPRRGERGIVLLLALILLLAMTVAGIALVRSVYTTNVIAGNLAFQQAATNSADTGVETAVAWLEAHNDSTLEASIQSGTGVRYLAHRQDPAPSQSWDDFWKNSIPAAAINTLGTDAAGNTVRYVIHRLCSDDGSPTAVACSSSPNDTGASGNSKGSPSGGPPLAAVPQVFYRITAQVSGPRNTQSYVQVVVAM